MSETTPGATALLAEFQKSREPLCLESAAALLEGVDLGAEPEATRRLALRRETMQLWLALVALIDRYLDAAFDAEAAPAAGLIPARIGAAALPAGVAVRYLPDPHARHAYEEMLRHERQRAEQYRLQVHLRRLSESVPPRAARFLRLFYTTVPGDQREVQETVSRLIQNPQRAAALLQAIPKPSV
jgi:hypothetical protein